MSAAGTGGTPPARPTHHRRHRLPILLAFVVLVAALGSLAYWGWTRYLGQSPTATLATGPQEVEVPRGATAEDVARSLEDAGIIASATSFLVQLRLAGGEESLKPGLYTFQPGQDFDAIVAELQQGVETRTVRLTVPEGLSLEQTAARVASRTDIPEDQYLTAARDPSLFDLPVLDGQPSDPADLEGYLFPSTYQLPEGEGAEQLVSRQLAAFVTHTAPLPWKKASDLKLTPYQVLIVASLIEKEARVPEERAKVAGVIYNRLREDMSLGIDATVRYAVGKWTGPLTKTDLAVDSPYNTRNRKGLPPGPIASPGVAALEAALSPETTDALYYVLVDEEGHHFFTASYDEFLRAQSRIPPSSR